MNKEDEVKKYIRENWFKDHKAVLTKHGDLEVLEWKKPNRRVYAVLLSVAMDTPVKLSNPTVSIIDAVVLKISIIPTINNIKNTNLRNIDQYLKSISFIT